jgi:hypothetical protein
MSEESKSLEDCVQEWSKGDDEAYQYWLEILRGKPYFIKSMQDLKDIAQYPSDWGKFVEQIGPPLSSRMRKWYEEEHKSKYIFSEKVILIFRGK